MCQETDTAKIAAAHGIDPRAFEDTLHALACFGWHVYAPGNPVIELVVAAVEYHEHNGDVMEPHDESALRLLDAGEEVAHDPTVRDWIERGRK